VAIELDITGAPLALSIDDEPSGFRVESALSTFAMSSSFRIRMVADHADPSLGPAAFVGRRVRVGFPADIGKPAARGVIRSFRHLGVEAGSARYEIDIASPLCLLALRTDSRFFKDQCVSDSVRQLLAAYGGDAPELRVLDESALTVHECRLQHDETDHDALFRLLAADGVASFFDLYAEGALTLIPDTRRLGRHAAVRVAFAPPGAVDAPLHRVREVEVDGSIASLGVRIHASEEAATSAVVARAKVGLDSVYERCRFEPGAPSEALLDRRADAALWAEYGASLTITLRGTAFVPPGSALRLSPAPHTEAAGEVLVIESRSGWWAPRSGLAAASSHELVCIPLQHRFVPQGLPKKRIPGLHRATVVGDGELDTRGRVLCRFGWDRDGSGTRRVPVGPGCGSAGGARARLGSEVLVSYLDGDPDWPVIVGGLG